MTLFYKITVETSLTRGWYMYLGMLSMIWTHPHATWHCRQWRINTIHVKCQRTEVAMNKPANQFTPKKETNRNEFNFSLFCNSYRYLCNMAITSQSMELINTLPTTSKAKTSRWNSVFFLITISVDNQQ